MDICCICVCGWIVISIRNIGSGPTGSTWLGGVATYTTIGDQCTEIVYYLDATVARCFHLVLQVLENVFL